ncbi:MAG: hypothetical protein MJ003_04865 [Paludibacteraceae bacterium]|nr:hypothetical protein [Paludibacteraceae bacterium]
MRTISKKFDRVEVCRNCKGSGKSPMGGTCPVCNGTGMIDKHLDIDITIKPHKNDNRR